MGLELEGNEATDHGDCVPMGLAQVGVVTSAARSLVLNKNIALCRVDVTYSDIGTKPEIGKLDGRQKRIPTTVIPFPFYDPAEVRVGA